MRPNPLSDVLTFLSAPGWTTPAFWLLLAGSIVIAIMVWRATPTQRTIRNAGIWLIRIVFGGMWWQQSLWKIPPNYDGLVYWMKQMIDHAAIPLQGQLVGTIMVPHITIFGPLVYCAEVAIGTAFILGIFTRGAALLGLAMAGNLWLGLYSAPGEWPWTYGFIVILQLLFLIGPPGRSLGADVLLRPRYRLAAMLG